MLAHSLAMENPLVQAEMVDANAFPALANRHQVRGVPMTVINDGAGSIVGALPEPSLVAALRQALD